MPNVCSGNSSDYMYDEDDEIMDLLSDDETDKSNENDTVVVRLKRHFFFFLSIFEHYSRRKQF